MQKAAPDSGGSFFSKFGRIIRYISNDIRYPDYGVGKGQ